MLQLQFKVGVGGVLYLSGVQLSLVQLLLQVEDGGGGVVLWVTVVLLWVELVVLVVLLLVVLLLLFQGRGESVWWGSRGGEWRGRDRFIMVLIGRVGGVLVGVVGTVVVVDLVEGGVGAGGTLAVAARGGVDEGGEGGLGKGLGCREFGNHSRLIVDQVSQAMDDVVTVLDR